MGHCCPRSTTAWCPGAAGIETLRLARSSRRAVFSLIPVAGSARSLPSIGSRAWGTSRGATNSSNDLGTVTTEPPIRSTTIRGWGEGGFQLAFGGAAPLDACRFARTRLHMRAARRHRASGACAVRLSWRLDLRRGVNDVASVLSNWLWRGRSFPPLARDEMHHEAKRLAPVTRSLSVRLQKPRQHLYALAQSCPLTAPTRPPPGT
jgi:hypothetical protein